MRAVADERELMRRIAEGNEHAFGQLYELYRLPLANLFYRLSFRRAMVDDLLQETFLRVWRAAGGFRGNSKVSTYIYRIAYNVWMNESRKKRPLPSSSAEGMAGAEEEVFLDERRRMVQEALRELSENDRVVLVLSEYNGLTYEEISEALGLPLGTVKSRAFYALRHLGEKLRERI